MATLYEITGDLRSLYDLMENLVDENGEPREPTAEEFETMKAWFTENEEDFKAKFDNYCRFIKNLRLSAENAEAEKKNFKAEADRLTKWSKALTNRAKYVTELLRWGMERLELKKFKTDFFSAGIQNVGGKTIDFESGADFSKLPEEFLMPREPNKKAILEALKDGTLEERPGLENITKLFFKGGERLPFVHVHQPDALVIR